jgi:hypothetical protein
MIANLVETKRKEIVTGSLLHNTVKCIYLNFTTATTDGGTGTFQTTAYGTVNISFPVKEIVIKQIGWADNANAMPGINDIGLMYSDLVGGGVLGSFNANNGGATASVGAPHTATIQNVRHVYKVPKNLQGQYQFTIQDMYGQPLPAASRTQAEAFVIAEFYCWSGDVTDVSV